MDANANSLWRNLPLLEFKEFPPKKKKVQENEQFTVEK